MSAPYPPGQPQRPEHRPGAPGRPPPFEFQAAPPPPQRSPAFLWTMRVLGLVGVAVLSGVVWFYIHDEDPRAPADDQTQQQQGEFVFTPHEQMPEPRVDATCPEHAYGDIQRFLQENTCVQLTRAIYTTIHDRYTVYTSVAVVEMADESTAEQLRVKTDTDGTGNVNDLVLEGEVGIKGLDSLAGQGYGSARDGVNVIVVECAYDPSAAGGGQKLLTRICEDATRYGEELTESS